VGEDVEALKRRLSLLDYLQQHNWTGHPASRSEFVGLCPLHEETRPSFYVNTRKDVFYCHGCGRGGDLIRFVQLSGIICPSARASPISIRRLLLQLDASAVLESGRSAFYRQQLDRYPRGDSAISAMRGVALIPHLIRELEIGYAPGGSLRRHLTAQGYPYDLLRQVGLLNAHGSDAFYQRIVFPLRRRPRHIVNLYGRSIGNCLRASLSARSPRAACTHGRRSGTAPEVILVEGLFDYAVHSGRRAFTTSPARWEPISTCRPAPPAVRRPAHRLSHLRCR
jgi:DNA primase